MPISVPQQRPFAHSEANASICQFLHDPSWSIHSMALAYPFGSFSSFQRVSVESPSPLVVQNVMTSQDLWDGPVPQTRRTARRGGWRGRVLSAFRDLVGREVGEVCLLLGRGWIGWTSRLPWHQAAWWQHGCFENRHLGVRGISENPAWVHRLGIEHIV